MAEICESWEGGGWKRRSIEEILGDTDRLIRCAECYGALRTHKAGEGVPAHFEHREGHTGCSLAQDFNGTKRKHPNPVMPPQTATSPALFINGVFKKVLEEILEAQKSDRSKICYLQPYSADRIQLLAKTMPTLAEPIRLYISLTDSLSLITHRAKIVGWRDKNDLEAHELSDMNNHIATFQPGETGIYFSRGGKSCVNLISIIQLEELSDPLPVSCFVKVSNDEPLQRRTRAGGWSVVFDNAEWLGMLETTVTAEQLESDYRAAVQRSQSSSREARQERLKNASKKPTQVQVISRGFRRNADVTAEVLDRAAGYCECCKKEAPFIRKADGTPYLEVHHVHMLADGGEDTVENSIALCPNCHRKAHHGTLK